MSNVLIYSGPGVSTSCLEHTLRTLRRLLSTYDVQTIRSKSIALDPWQDSTSLFVLPGGRDLPFVQELQKEFKIERRELGRDGKDLSSTSTSTSTAPTTTTTTTPTTTTTAAKQIKSYVESGGKFIGICAGAYYSSDFCQFQKGDANLQVVGERYALQFFRGICKGAVYPGFQYDSQVGSRLVKLQLLLGDAHSESDLAGSLSQGQSQSENGNQDGNGKKESETKIAETETTSWWNHYNGGGAFLDAEKDPKVEIIARYPKADPELKSNLEDFDYSDQAAIISCRVGNSVGKAVLFGTHPEFPLDFKNRNLQSWKEGRNSLPFLEREREKEDEKEKEKEKETQEKSESRLQLDQEQILNLNLKAELEIAEHERLTKFAQILRDHLGLIVSFPKSSIPTAEKSTQESLISDSNQPLSTSTATRKGPEAKPAAESEIKLTPLYLVSQDQSKVDRILNVLRTIPTKGKQTGKYIPHLKELILSSKPSTNDSPVDQFSTPFPDSHILSFQDVNDTFHFYSSNPLNPESNSGSSSRNLDSTISNLCERTDYSIFKTTIEDPSGSGTGKKKGDENIRSEVETETDLHKVPKYILTYSPPSGDHGVDSDELNQSRAGMMIPDPERNPQQPKKFLPEKSLTPHFDLSEYFQFLELSRQRLKKLDFGFKIDHGWFGEMKQLTLNEDQDEAFSGKVSIGDPLIYSQVVTSTQTMLDKNYKFLTNLPDGLTILATHQATGRGRGSNNWISPLGCLQFSTLLRLDLKQSSDVVFVQYLAGLSIAQAVKHGLGEEYRVIGEKIRIKWPNDVYALVEEAGEKVTDGENASKSIGNGEGKRSGNGSGQERKGTFQIENQTYAKLAGVLVNSSFSKDSFSLIVGCGINCLNERPTTSLSDLIKNHNLKTGESLPIVSQEKLAGAVLATLERFWNVFQRFGFQPFVDMYRDTWLHSDQIVTLEDTIPPTRARIVGIAIDHGTLRAVPISSETTSESRGAWGRTEPHISAHASDWNRNQANDFIDLQPDGNSFDMLKNLIRSKK